MHDLSCSEQYSQPLLVYAYLFITQILRPPLYSGPCTLCEKIPPHPKQDMRVQILVAGWMYLEGALSSFELGSSLSEVTFSKVISKICPLVVVVRLSSHVSAVQVGTFMGRQSWWSVSPNGAIIMDCEIENRLLLESRFTLPELTSANTTYCLTLCLTLLVTRITVVTSSDDSGFCRRLRSSKSWNKEKRVHQNEFRMLARNTPRGKHLPDLNGGTNRFLSW